MSNTNQDNIIATYAVNVGDGEVVRMTGNTEKMDEITRQMQVHGRLIELLKECADYIERVSEATHRQELDFANYDLLDAVETAVASDTDD